MNLNLKPDGILQTARLLKLRIEERFPESGLNGVAGDLTQVAQASAARAREIGRPNYGLRFIVFLFWGGTLALLIGGAYTFKLEWGEINTLRELIEFVEPAIGNVVFLGAAAVFLFSLEGRFKRKRALSALHELRSIAHVIDMHQLTKDPERLLQRGPRTASSPTLQMTPFELGRYLDYCSEMLSLLAKVAALYAQELDDDVSLGAVDQIESLTTGLSRKIWQKRMVLDQFEDEGVL